MLLSLIIVSDFELEEKILYFVASSHSVFKPENQCRQI